MNRMIDQAVVLDFLNTLYEENAANAEQNPNVVTVQNNNCCHNSQWVKSNSKSFIENTV